ncbi:EF hand, partial [Onchocerca flexuosa]
MIYTNGRGYLDRDDFLRIPELAVNPLGDRIVDAFFTETEDLEQKINFREFIRVLAHFRPISKEKKNVLNSREEKLKFAFSMYDLNKNGFITRDEFKVILNMMVGANITAEQVCFLMKLQNYADFIYDKSSSFCEGIFFF